MLESENLAVEYIGSKVGHTDPIFFRRLFKRLTGLSPGNYHRMFQRA